jgi:mannosyltransferase
VLSGSTLRPMHDVEPGRPETQIDTDARPEIIVLAAVALAIGLFTRFVTRSSLWLDEALSVNIAQLPLGEMTEALKHDGHPPFYYALLHGWMNIFGSGDVAVRGLSGLIGIAVLPLVWVLGRRKGGTVLAWVAVAVVAISPFAVRYSNETRMYSLVIFLVVIGWLLVDDIVGRKKATFGRFIVLALVGAALLYTHYWSIWLLGAVGITSLWKVWRASDRSERRPWAGIAISTVVAGVAFLPWLPTMLFQSANTGTPWAKASRPTSALSLVLADNGGGTYGEQTLVAAMFAMAMVLGLFGIAIDRRTTALDLRTRPPFRGAAWIAALTFVIGCIISFATSSAFASRYSAVIFPFLALLAAAGCVSFASRWVRFGVVAVFCSLLAIGAFWNVIWQRTELKVIADAVAASSQDGDIVVFCPDQLGPAGSRVMPSGLTLVSYPTYDDGRFVDWVDYAQRNAASDPEAFAARLLAEAGSTRSIYLVWNDSYKTFEGKCGGLLAALAAARPPEQLIGDDGERYFEHAALTRFAAPT